MNGMEQQLKKLIIKKYKKIKKYWWESMIKFCMKAWVESKAESVAESSWK